MSHLQKENKWHGGKQKILIAEYCWIFNTFVFCVQRLVRNEDIQPFLWRIGWRFIKLILFSLTPESAPSIHALVSHYSRLPNYNDGMVILQQHRLKKVKLKNRNIEHNRETIGQIEQNYRCKHFYVFSFEYAYFLKRFRLWSTIKPTGNALGHSVS